MAESKKGGASNLLQRIKGQSDLILAITVVLVVLFLIIPMPTMFLDFLIAVNIMAALIVLLTITYLKRAADFSVFPSLILLTTVFRIVLNVSSTRLILTQGKNFEGKIIQAFGKFVVGNNYVVGLVIFLILVALQFIVITKGATRVAEVAARFSLDGMPVKMMAIDTELAQGRISDEEAERKRKEVRQESDFYGSMDGASKFVSGDVKLGFLITVINIIGGIVVGMSQGMDIGSSAKLFLRFTVGDGLVSQIPSILLSLGTGIIVTRAVSNDSLGTDIKNQLTLKPKTFFVTGGFLFALAWVPGLPKITLFVLSTGISALGYYILKNRENEEIEKERQKEMEAEAQTKGPEDVTKMAVSVDPIELEIGFNLIPLVDATSEYGDLLERIKVVRRSCAIDLGLIVPPIRIRDNLKLRANDYIIKIKGVEEARGTVKHTKLLAVPKKGMEDNIEGEPTLDPTFKEPAKWIERDKLEEAESMGYTVVDASTVISSHITEIIKQNADTLMGRKEVADILDSIRETNAVVVDEVSGLNNQKGYSTVQKVLKNLLKEQVSIRNMVTILETISDNISNREVLSMDAYGNSEVNVDRLTEFVRQKLAKQICIQYTDDNDTLHAFLIDPPVQQFIETTVQNMGQHLSTNISDQDATLIISAIFNSSAKFIDEGILPVIVCDSSIRSVIRELIVYYKSRFPEYSKPAYNLPVLSYSELVKNVNIDNLGIIEVPEVVMPAEQEVDEYGY
jgi:flagellar biosynthesis protein FlhA